MCKRETRVGNKIEVMPAKIDKIMLIEMVRQHECLYNMKSKHYRDQNMRGEAWEEIAEKMGLAGK